MEDLKRAERLKTLTTMEGWSDVISLINNISQGMYPNPEEKKYDLFPWKNIEKDYTYARGGTKVASEFLSIMSQQADIAKSYQDRLKDIREEKEEDLYAQLQNGRN